MVLYILCTNPGRLKYVLEVIYYIKCIFGLDWVKIESVFLVSLNKIFFLEAMCSEGIDTKMAYVIISQRQLVSQTKSKGAIV